MDTNTEDKNSLPLHKRFVTEMCIIGLSCLTYYIIACQDLSYVGGGGGRACQQHMAEGVTCLSDDDITNTYNMPPDQVENIPFRIVTRLGRADILFIVDDSPSMIEEHKSIAGQFDRFLNQINATDYHISIITADLSNGGRFLEFPDGSTILKSQGGNHAENVRHFQDTITRIGAISNTNDERGVAVANMVLDQKENDSFFRAHSLFIVIIISDEDERSFGGRKTPNHYKGAPLPLPLETIDQPEEFFKRVSLKHAFTQVMAHAIIVKPGDTSCLNKSQGVEGYVYRDLAQPDNSIKQKYGNIRSGHVASICETEYGSQLSPIGAALTEVVPISLPCVPEPSSIRLNIEGNADVSYKIEGRMIHIDDQVHYGAETEIVFFCQSNENPNI